VKIELALNLATASVANRTIEGTVTLYGQRAHASSPLVINAGSVVVPDELSRVKLLIDHDHTQPVGYLVDYTDDATELRGKFHVPEGAAGDDALTQAANGLRDGISIGLELDDDGYTFDEDGYLNISRAYWREATLCAIPAMDAARVADVVASLRKSHPTKGNQLMLCSTCGQQHAPGIACTAPTATAAVATTPALAPEPVTVATAAAPAAAAPAPITTQPRGVMTLRAAAELISNVRRQGGSAQDVRAALGLTVGAALADVVPADDAGTGFLRPSWIGELWRASQSRRPFIELLGTPKPLTSLKVEGWQWDVEPQVVDYAGNKSAVTGNEVSTKPAFADAKRKAGGWDVDRIYVDLGSPGIIEALFEAATEDYRRKTEASVAADLVAGASTAPAATSLTGALVALGFAATQLGASISGVGFGADVWTAFTGLTRDEVPWWLGSGDSINIGTTEGNVGGLKLFYSPGLAATQVLGLDSRAATYYEVDPPIRVQAVDVANGGIDLGVFGYHALIINDARAVIKTTVTPAP
jgi:HK97 family phage prohead protease